MKKISILLLFIFSFIASFSQTYPSTQILGAPQTLVLSKGGLKADSSLIIPAFSDTFAANRSGYINKYPGSLIRVQSNMFIRNATATQWLQFTSSAPSVDTTSLSNRINNKIDSLQVSNDSVYALKYKIIGGVPITTKSFQFIKGGGSSNAIDSIRRKTASDSVFGYINGAPVFQFKDSIGGGSSADTSNAFVNNIQKVNDSTLRFYKGSTNTNLVLSNGRFKKNIILNGNSSTRLGVWTNLDTIKVAGMDLDSAFRVITQKAQPVTYTAPTVTLNYTAINPPTTYEVGANTLGTITLSRTFNINDGGNENGWTYSKIDTSGTSTLATNPNQSVINTIGKLTPNNSVTYRVVSSYDTGACKTNNLGQIDCTGRIVAGSTSPSSITYNTNYRRFWGYCAGTVPTNAEILAAAGGGSELNATGTKSSFSVTIPNIGYRRIFYAYYSASTALSQIKDPNGFNLLAPPSPSWTRSASINFRNVYNYYYTLQIYVTNEEYQNTTLTYNSIQ